MKKLLNPYSRYIKSKLHVFKPNKPSFSATCSSHCSPSCPPYLPSQPSQPKTSTPTPFEKDKAVLEAPSSATHPTPFPSVHPAESTAPERSSLAWSLQALTAISLNREFALTTTGTVNQMVRCSADLVETHSSSAIRED